MFVSALS
jgi:hypothetical protein